MATEMRKTGVDVVGDMPWGTHFCLFYETRADLLETLVCYCKAGLENQEFCLWVVAEPVSVEEATRALKQAVPDLDQYLSDHSIEIVGARDWYFPDGVFDLNRVISGWNEKLARASARGYVGVRVTGDTAWLEKKDWKDFCEYEESLNQAIANQRLAVLCTYPLAACGAAEILDVVRTHQFAVTRRRGGWDVIETAGHKQAKAEIKRLNEELEERVIERTSQLTASNRELTKEVAQRLRAEAALRRSEAYLAEAQRLMHTGSFGWKVSTGQLLWSEESFRIFQYDRSTTPTVELISQRVHPEDAALVKETIERASKEGRNFDFEHRLVMPDGSIKHVHIVAHAERDDTGEVEFVGAVMDVSGRKQAEEALEALRQAQTDLARVNRVTTMGELTAALAHEVNQPIAAAVTSAHSCVHWLAGAAPNLDKARAAAMRIVKDGTRAAEIITRIRLLFQKGAPQWQLVNVNEIIGEMVLLLHAELMRYSISVRTELANDLPLVMGDRVQLQQVIMNLMTNGIDAMKAVDGTRELAIISRRAEDGQLQLSVSDSGVGLPPQQMDQIFEAFFTTKPSGTGMGLRICRSIVESHGGRLWAANNASRGARFLFTIPSKVA
jgi:C4-dicarboxylate-specific signal transduction histidine kinase